VLYARPIVALIDGYYRYGYTCYEGRVSNPRLLTSAPISSVSRLFYCQ
jgi:hypothetical protein